MSFQKLTWDSAFFGFSVARATSSGDSSIDAFLKAKSLAMQENVRLLYYLSTPLSSAEREQIQSAGGLFLCTNVDFEKKIEIHPPSIYPIHEASAFVPELEVLAFQSGEYSRFKRDPNFVPGTFERLYREWVVSSLFSLDGTRKLLVAGDADAPMGFVSYSILPEKCKIGLFSISSMCQRQGLGRQLMQEVETRCGAGGAQVLQVATQRENEKAMCFYEKYGFHLVDEMDIFHLWL